MTDKKTEHLFNRAIAATRKPKALGSNMDAWNVYLGKKLIDNVFYTKGMTADEVQRSLINHDGYSADIRVVKQRSKPAARGVDTRSLSSVKRRNAHGATVSTPSRLPSQQEYEMNERRLAQAKEKEVEKAPLSERKEAQRAFLEAMRDQPELVGERIGWLLDGNYGYGAMIIAKEILPRKRMNREAILTHLVGVHEWQVPPRMSIAAWKMLTPSQQQNLDKAVKKAIEGAEAENE